MADINDDDETYSLKLDISNVINQNTPNENDLLVSYTISNSKGQNISTNTDTDGMVARLISNVYTYNGNFDSADHYHNDNEDYDNKNRNNDNYKLILFIKKYIKQDKKLTKETKDNIKRFITKNKTLVNYRGERGKTALYYSVKAKNQFITNLLIENGADLNYQYGQFKETLLMMLIKGDNYDWFKLLATNKKINLNIQDENGDSAAMVALQCANHCKHLGSRISSKYIKYMTTLYDLGADITLKNIDGENILDLVTQGPHYGVIEYLFNKNISLCNPSYTIDQILHVLLASSATTCNNFVDIVETLLENGAKVPYIFIEYDMAIGNMNDYIRLFILLLKYYTIDKIYFDFVIITSDEIEHSTAFETFKTTDIFKFFIENGFDENVFDIEISEMLDELSENIGQRMLSDIKTKYITTIHYYNIIEGDEIM